MEAFASDSWICMDTAFIGVECYGLCGLILGLRFLELFAWQVEPRLLALLGVECWENGYSLLDADVTRAFIVGLSLECAA
ncbi:hypothetical protein BDU57DRAFT_520642 [Ampelomyces quisqualis]|uniref:Uncharacterized protein n=1 Tax=Ampelomyces quisqualis TaxID=50730 RepID=A0A6A5QEA7_AMPQU|nr:hypothetical protein BDU57DRAFT_520642 [Ampelomyces quisqualis]